MDNPDITNIMHFIIYKEDTDNKVIHLNKDMYKKVIHLNKDMVNKAINNHLDLDNNKPMDNIHLKAKYQLFKTIYKVILRNIFYLSLVIYIL